MSISRNGPVNVDIDGRQCAIIRVLAIVFECKKVMIWKLNIRAVRTTGAIMNSFVRVIYSYKCSLLNRHVATPPLLPPKMESLSYLNQRLGGKNLFT